MKLFLSLIALTFLTQNAFAIGIRCYGENKNMGIGPISLSVTEVKYNRLWDVTLTQFDGTAGVSTKAKVLEPKAYKPRNPKFKGFLKYEASVSTCDYTLLVPEVITEKFMSFAQVACDSHFDTTALVCKATR